jgi:2'-5' RNA ligase
MARLFIAIDLPAAVTDALAALQPAAMPGLRLINVNQMHLTLHYIGEAELERIAARLGKLAEPMIALSLCGVGHFQSADERPRSGQEFSKAPN